MDSDQLQELPENVQKYIKSLEKQLTSKTEENEYLQEKLKEALRRKFGRSTEKIDPNQKELFEELENTLEDTSDDIEQIEVPGHTRKKRGPKPLDASIPREEILHDISDEEKQCACGCTMSEISRESTERLNVIPEKIYVERHIYPKYACKSCEGSGDEEKPVIRKAPAEPSIIPGSIVTPGLLAFILMNKFVDHLPFYRQEKRFERIGAKISRQNMSNWAMKAYQQLGILKVLYKKALLSGTFLQMDETPVQVMNEEERSNTSKSYMWVARGGPPSNPVTLYEYYPRRNAAFINDFLEGYSGYLQADGFGAYEAADKINKNIFLIGCLAHIRRKLFEASKAGKKTGSAHQALSMIQKIYRVEKELRERDLSDPELLEEREKRVLPLLDNFSKWLEEKALTVRNTSKTGEAISYALKQWSKLIRYIQCPQASPDNNGAENAIRPFVVGRKNWLFSGSPKGAEASCFYYSLIETAKQNKIDPYSYLAYVFREVPRIKQPSEWEALLPWNYKDMI